MKKLFLLSAACFLVFIARAQIVNIPDANFKAALVGNTSINTNGDGEIQVSEASAFTGTISVSWEFISNLTGIEAFTSLIGLDCSWNQLTTLDFSNNTALIGLSCSYNDLTSLNISNNTALTQLWCEACQLTSLDVSNNTALNIFGCNSNQLTTLDISNNTVLDYILCFDNLFTTLDVSNNTLLNTLDCHYNQLTNLDVSNNPALLFLDCANNQLNTLNLSNNLNLNMLICYNNQLNTLDLSNNTALNDLGCFNNQLTSLNVKNGNNVNFGNFNTTNNPNLYCIEVDNTVWSIANLTGIDSWTSFSINCFYNGIPHNISGKVVIDDNCVIDGTEQNLGGIVVKTVPDYYYGVTNNFGIYSIPTDTGTYQVEQVIPATNGLLINPLCPIPNFYSVSFITSSPDATDIDFFNEGIACPFLTIGVNSDRRRRCFTNNTYIHYCNDGFADADSVEIHVQLPDYVIFISANYPYTIDTLGNYVFDIGNLPQGDCGDIHIIDSVACINGITGLTQCTEAWITPANDCANSLDTAAYNAWDHSSVMVEGECIGDSLMRFVITNTGDYGLGDMQIPSEYRIYADNLLVFTGTFQLNGQEEMVIDIVPNGQTVRLEADQHPMHPGNSHPNETIEECGSSPAGLGFVDNQSMDDADAEIEIDCMQILDSYDPNDKSVSPQGITANNFVMPGTSLDYVIRFQNTGSDTAFTVIVVDTLSSHLDISTLQWGISSHPYTIDVSGHGSPVLMFTFNNINLPDSTTNEANSHGFVKFKIAPLDSLANGTVIENTADIYFDYNIPVITNTAMVTISDTIIYGYPLEIFEAKDVSSITNFKAMPNPFSEQIDFIFENNSIYEIRILNILGKEVYSTRLRGNSYSVSTSELPAGTYLIQVKSAEGVGMKKMVKQ
jgi:uncharacterized repeat protein (TIGR01451 family)